MNANILVPSVLYDLGYGPNEIGTYVYLASHAGKSAIHNGAFSLNSVTKVSLFQDLYHTRKKSGNYQSLRDDFWNAVQKLCEDRLLRLVENTGAPGQYDIIFAEIDSSKGFSTVHSIPVAIILKESKGKRALSLLASYAALRRPIFLGDKNSQLFEKPSSYYANIINISRSTQERNMKWLREHRAIAYFKCLLDKPIPVLKCYYADIDNRAELKSKVSYSLQHGFIKQILE